MLYYNISLYIFYYISKKDKNLYCENSSKSAEDVSGGLEFFLGGKFQQGGFITNAATTSSFHDSPTVGSL